MTGHVSARSVPCPVPTASPTTVVKRMSQSSQRAAHKSVSPAELQLPRFIRRYAVTELSLPVDRAYLRIDIIASQRVVVVGRQTLQQRPPFAARLQPILDAAALRDTCEEAGISQRFDRRFDSPRAFAQPLTQTPGGATQARVAIEQQQ